MRLKKSLYSGQPVQSAQADLGRNFFVFSSFPACGKAIIPLYSVSCYTNFIFIES